SGGSSSRAPTRPRVGWPIVASPSAKSSLASRRASSPDQGRLPDAHAGQHLNRIARLEVEGNEELHRLVHLRPREPSRDLREHVGNGFQAKKPPFALINESGVQAPKTHHQPVPLGPNRERPVRGMLVPTDDFVDRKVECGLPDTRECGRHFPYPSLPVQGLEPKKAIV